MPVTTTIPFANLSETDFKTLDYEVMGHVFSSHNDLGRFHDERIYEQDLQARLLEAGHGPVETEVPLTVSWKDFTKTYRLDLVVQRGLVYELKSASALTAEHQTQLLNYLLLLGLSRGKLVNFRGPSVEARFVSTRLTAEIRRRINCDTARWQDVSPACARLRETLVELLQDWGAFLELALYREALVWFLGGADQVTRRLDIHRQSIRLGTQPADLHASNAAFRLTAHTDSLEQAEIHLRRYLQHTDLNALQWINFHHHQVTFITLTH